MSSSNPSDQPSLDKAIEDALAALERMMPEDDEYAKATDQLVKLHKLKMEEEKLELEESAATHKHALDVAIHSHQAALDARPQKVNKDTLVLAGANLLGIVAIICHEQLGNIVTSKAFDLFKSARR